jgi:hypothetical protein
MFGRYLHHVASPALPKFSILSHKRYDFRGKKKVIEGKMPVLNLSTNVI